MLVVPTRNKKSTTLQLSLLVSLQHKIGSFLLVSQQQQYIISISRLNIGIYFTTRLYIVSLEYIYIGLQSNCICHRHHIQKITRWSTARTQSTRTKMIILVIVMHTTMLLVLVSWGTRITKSSIAWKIVFSTSPSTTRSPPASCYWW